MTAGKLAMAYLSREKKQTLALFVGILLAASLLTGIGSLFSSGLNAAKENARLEYGDWHYSTRCDLPWYDAFMSDPTGDDFDLQSYGVETVRKAIEEPFAIQYVSADSGYMEMMGRSLLEGKMPESNHEVAMDKQTLRNLGASAELGSSVTLDDETFTLCGIVAEMPEKLSEQMGDFMQVFVGPNLDYGMNGRFIYLKFDESKSVADQMAAFTAKYGIDGSTVELNKGLSSYVGTDAASMTPKEILGALKDPSLGIPYVWGMLNENQAMTEGAVLVALIIFAGFIIYSIFQVSVLKRMKQYSIMQTLGLTDGGIWRLLLCELFLIFAVAYSIGCIIGNMMAAALYKHVGRIFVTRHLTYHAGIDTSQIAAEQSVSNIPDAGAFQVDWSLIIGSALVLSVILIVICSLLVRKMKQLSLRQMMVNDQGKRRRNRKMMSLHHGSLTGVLTKRFMFERKSAFIGILLSLAIGGIIFLSAAYVIDNTRTNNLLTFAADDGLGSDIQLIEETGALSATIPDDVVKNLRTLEGVAEVLPVRYQLGEISLPNGMFHMPKYYPEIANEEGFEQDPEIMERYNGIIVQTGEDDYRLKVNIYGYDDAMLTALNDYLIDGTIDPDKMRKDNSVIVKTLSDGQGNTDGVDFLVGDDLTIKTPNDPEAEGEVLGFLADENQYQESTFTMAAIVSRPLGKVETTIGDDGESVVDIIMTNEQMEKYFGVSGYQTVSVSLTDDADPLAVSDAIRALTAGISGCLVQDYSAQIAAQNMYLTQQMFFFYGIAFVLLAISLLHIMNSMHYLVVERRREFTILRAMGITDAGFLRMMAKEGIRYGIYASLAMLFAFMLVQKVLYYFLVHVYLYLHPTAMISGKYFLIMTCLNIFVCMFSMLLSGKQVLQRSILEQ